MVLLPPALGQIPVSKVMVSREKSKASEICDGMEVGTESDHKSFVFQRNVPLVLVTTQTQSSQSGVVKWFQVVFVGFIPRP